MRRQQPNLDAVSALSKEYDCPIAVKASKVGDVAKLSAKLMEKGHKDIVLDSGHRNLAELLAGQRYDPSSGAGEAVSSARIPHDRISRAKWRIIRLTKPLWQAHSFPNTAE